MANKLLFATQYFLEDAEPTFWLLTPKLTNISCLAYSCAQFMAMSPPWLPQPRKSRLLYVGSAGRQRPFLNRFGDLSLLRRIESRMTGSIGQVNRMTRYFQTVCKSIGAMVSVQAGGRLIHESTERRW